MGGMVKPKDSENFDPISPKMEVDPTGLERRSYPISSELPTNQGFAESDSLLAGVPRLAAWAMALMSI